MDSRKRRKVEEFPCLSTIETPNFEQSALNGSNSSQLINSRNYTIQTLETSEEHHSQLSMDETKSIHIEAGTLSCGISTNNINQTYYNVSEKYQTAFVMEPIKSNQLALFQSSNVGGTQNVIEYRVIGQLPVNTPELSKPMPETSTIESNAALPVQLVNKCGEIFVIKGLINPPPSSLTVKNIVPKTMHSEPINGYPVAIQKVPVSLQRIPPLISPKVSATNADGENKPIADYNSDPKLKILESSKKRDDKRRANHNETERRRRDKINNWIFKLKELIPPDGLTNQQVDSDAISLSENSEEQQKISINVNRNTSNDSKGQILIKACECIKAMQQEIKSLRECLVENEGLRITNQRLQNELDQLKNSIPSNKNGKIDNKIQKREFVD